MGRALYLFSGEPARKDGIAAVAAQCGVTVEEIDVKSGVPAHDMSVASNRRDVLEQARRGRWRRFILTPPCDSFSVAHANGHNGRIRHGARSWRHPSGAPGLPADRRRYLAMHDSFVQLTADLLQIALDADLDIIIENPAQRHLPHLPSYWKDRAHLPQIWDMPVMAEVLRRAGPKLKMILVPQCAFGPGPHGRTFQKWTALCCSAGPARRLADWERLSCNHDEHGDVAVGRDDTGAAVSAMAASYPGPMNVGLVWGLTARRPPSTRHATTRTPRAASTSVTPTPPPPPQRRRVSFQLDEHDQLKVQVVEYVVQPSAGAADAPLAAPRDATPRTDQLEPQPMDGGDSDNGQGETSDDERPAPPAPPRFDRSIRAGRVADGETLGDHVRRAVEAARQAPPKWASFRNLEPASQEELRRTPMPDLLPQAQTTVSPGPPTQPGAAARLRAFRTALGRNVRHRDLWLPAAYERLQRWMQRAAKGKFQPPAIFDQDELAELARGFVWDCRDPDNCIPMQPSSRHTVFPGKRQFDRAAFRRVAAEVGSTDKDIIGQCGEGGVESRSTCPLTTELHCHAPGVWERHEAAAAAVQQELDEEWALGPFYHTPTVPFRALPRDVLAQARSRVLPDGTVQDYEKDRISLNPSKGANSVNGGIPKHERRVALTSARQLGLAAAVTDVAAADAGIEIAIYGTDITAAYSFLQMQRLDWWQFGYIWFDAQGRLCFCILIRVGFGGAMSPRRFQSVSVIITALARKRQAQFDRLHPLPPEVQLWCVGRQELQRAGLLPAGPEHCRPDAAGVYIDDGAGCCCNDAVAMPDDLYGVDTTAIQLGDLSAVANGGRPLARDSRGAAHCVIFISAIRELRLEEAPAKTEGGTAVVNLGLRLDVRRRLIDCPGPKRRILLRDLGAWRDDVLALRPFDRKVAERQSGRIGNLTQVMPELLKHLDAGFAAANASYVSHGTRRKLDVVRLAAGSKLHRGLSALLPHAIAVIEANEGVPLAPAAAFAALGDKGVVTVTSDASGHDGFGGYVFFPARGREPVIFSAAWPDDVKDALEQSKRSAVDRSPGAPTLSMPAAELFTSWAVAEAAIAAAADGASTRAIIAVGDCDPAAAALNAASSSTPQMSTLLVGARVDIRQWLGVSIPREWNLDADRLSHPAQLADVVADARAAGLSPLVIEGCEGVPERCWRTLREAMALAADD